MIFLLLVLPAILAQEKVLYDRYTGEPFNPAQRAVVYKNLGLRSAIDCTREIYPCNPNEPRRMDSSCNNLQRPMNGTAGSRYVRMLPPKYGPGDSVSVRQSNGSALPSAREVRTQVVANGYVTHNDLNMIGMHWSGFLVIEITKIEAIDVPLTTKPYCCTPLGAIDPECMPISIPADDPFYAPLRITCMNATRTRTFQDYGCVDKTVPRDQINFQTTLLDLSVLYGVDEKAANRIRAKRGGLLLTEERQGRVLPISGEQTCIGNQLDKNEEVCPVLGESGVIFDWRLATVAFYFYGEHNRLATLLSNLNPCWSDEQLFQTARNINIGSLQNIAFYEWAPIHFGTDRLLNAGLIYETDGFVDDYEKSLEPATFAEFTLALRRLHTLLDGRIQMFSENGTSLNTIRIADIIFRMAPLEFGDTLESVTRGSFLQPAADDDLVADPIVGGDLFAQFHSGSDLVTFDIQRARDFGVPPYNDFREECGMRRARQFTDFLDVMMPEQIKHLERVYGNVEDVELFPALISEATLPDSITGPTLWCIARRQLMVWRKADRFWFERSGHPNSFTLEQLHEIRKTTFSRIACDNGHGITKIQPRGFLNVMPGNEQIPCSELPAVDITYWKDPICEKNHSDEL